MKILSFFTTLLSLFSCAAGSYTHLDVKGFEACLGEGRVVVLDVRTPDEYAGGHLRGAVNADWYAPDFLMKVEAAWPKEVPLAVYCRSGKRSAAAASALAKAGYTVCNLQGGYLAWMEAGKPVVTFGTEVFLTDGNIPVAVTLIKHGSLEFAYNGCSVQVDPVAGYGKPTDYAAGFPKADVILVTHEHPDHLDDVTLRGLSDDRTRLILNHKSAAAIGRGEVVGNGDSLDLPSGIRLDAVPAYNTTPGREKFHPKGSGNGYVLTMDGFRIYVAGDTEDIPEMAALKDIDLAFLPVNQPYTMTPEQCVRATGMIAPKVLIPYHFSQTDLSSIPGRLPGIKVLLRDMQ